MEPTRRLDLVFSIGYGDDFEKAKRIIRGALGDNPLRTGIPSRSSACPSTATPAIKIACRVWVDTPDYWTLNFDLLEEVKRRFDAEGISIPYNQMDVHLHRTGGQN